MEPSIEFYKEALLKSGKMAQAVQGVLRADSLCLSSRLNELRLATEDYDKFIFAQAEESYKAKAEYAKVENQK
jgi:hypothetical protein